MEESDEVGIVGVHVLKLRTVVDVTVKSTDLKSAPGECEIRLFPDSRATVAYLDPLCEGTWSQDKEDYVLVAWDMQETEPTEQTQETYDTQKIVWKILRDGFQYVPLPKASITDPEIEATKWVAVSRDKKTHLVFGYQQV